MKGMVNEMTDKELYDAIEKYKLDGGTGRFYSEFEYKLLTDAMNLHKSVRDLIDDIHNVYHAIMELDENDESLEDTCERYQTDLAFDLEQLECDLPPVINELERLDPGSSNMDISIIEILKPLVSYGEDYSLRNMREIAEHIDESIIEASYNEAIGTKYILAYIEHLYNHIDQMCSATCSMATRNISSTKTFALLEQKTTRYFEQLASCVRVFKDHVLYMDQLGKYGGYEDLAGQVDDLPSEFPTEKGFAMIKEIYHFVEHKSDLDVLDATADFTNFVDEYYMKPFRKEGIC